MQKYDATAINSGEFKHGIVLHCGYIRVFPGKNKKPNSLKYIKSI